MTISPHPSERVVVDGALTLKTIGEVKAKLLGALSEYSTVEVDCSNAAEMDVSGAQLLLAALKSARRAGKQLSLEPPMPPALCTVLTRTGLAEAFESLIGQDAAPITEGEA